MLDRQTLLSVIMPVYNGEKYIEAAVRSVLNQPQKDLVLIVVDDGSQDHTRDILHKIEMEDQRLLVHSQTNSGVSSARNKGIDISASLGVKYIAFLDADDVWCKDFYTEKIKHLLCGNQYDYIGFDHYFGSENLNRGKLCCQKDSDSLFGTPFCSYIYKLEMIESNHIYFPTHCNYNEDIVFRFIVSYYSNHYVCVHNCIFIYRSNPQSVVHQQKKAYETYFLSVLPAWDWVMKILSNDISIASQCKTMIRTYLIEYIQVACEQGVKPSSILNEIIDSKYNEYFLQNEIWISENSKKNLRVFLCNPKIYFLKNRLKAYLFNVKSLLRRSRIVQFLRYPERIDYLVY